MDVDTFEERTLNEASPAISPMEGDSLSGGIVLSGVLSEDAYRWMKLAAARELHYRIAAAWTTATRHLDEVRELGTVLHETHIKYGRLIDLILDIDGMLVEVTAELSAGKITLHIASHLDRRDDVGGLVGRFHELLPELQPAEGLRTGFWWLSRQPVRIQRRINAPRWEEVAENYPDRTRAGVQSLVDLREPADSGQLLLWHGPPGTGKTWGLRALGRAWKEWCDFEFITDPEHFFGAADYMMHVLLNGPDRPFKAEAEPTRWRLLILEDTGEMLAADAKAREGQRLSRLLNVVDGFIGQGLRIMILVTTNEELRSLHPAVSRAGRCASRVEFERFAEQDARSWLTTRGACLEAKGPQTLAELYAASHGRTIQTRPPSIGFGSASVSAR